jgi:glycosyltransferase involved in cell wall biosynthesis
MMSAAVVTVSNGRKTLDRTIQSVVAQTHPCKHYLALDGIISFDEFVALKNKHPQSEVLWCSQKVGGPMLEGRRLLAAMSYLVKEDVIFFLNDDDWYEPDHVESLMKIIKSGCDWAYSHRQIYDQNGQYVCHDLCESLGEEHDVWNSPRHRFVETCSIAMKTEIMVQLAQVYWPAGYGPDRVFYHHAKQLFPNFRGSKKATMCFTVDGNDMSVKSDFFLLGNQHMKEKYPDGMPWL